MEVLAIKSDMVVETASSPPAAKREPPAQAPSAGQAEGAQVRPEEKPPVKDEQVKEAARELQLRFDVKVELAHDEKSGRSVVRILSSDGQRVLRQMPPEAAIALADRARRGSVEGLLSSLV